VNLGTTPPAGLVGWDVKKVTTDKLEATLNEYTEGWTVEHITFIGGRDWVIIARMEFASYEDRDAAFGD